MARLRKALSGRQSSRDESRDSLRTSFGYPLREDRNGKRAVFLLGNERQEGCPYQCRFCNVKNLSHSTREQNKSAFESQYREYRGLLAGQRYHALIYNSGNATNEIELARDTLDYILTTFNCDDAVEYSSINSRQELATRAVLDHIAIKRLNYPVHLIFGLESFSESMARVLGKDTRGDLERYIEKLRGYNQKTPQNNRRGYVFGLDVALLFLPELYLGEGEGREGNFEKIKGGIAGDLRKLLAFATGEVPIEINLHCFSKVDGLPYESADYASLISMVTELQGIVEEHNLSYGGTTHIFLGQYYDESQSSDEQKEKMAHLNRLTAAFNKTGRLF
jgi:hypothetical protein